MVTDTREIEMKYEAGPETVLPPLEDLPRVASEAGPNEVKLEAEYYDTADLRLLRAGVTLRAGAVAARTQAGTSSSRPGRRPAGRCARRWAAAAGPSRPSWPAWSASTPGARSSHPSPGSRPCAGHGP